MSETLENLLNETRQFPPPAELAANANVKAEAYDEAEADRLGFWEAQAARLSWSKKWDQVLDWSNPPFAKWFVGGAAQRRVQLPRPARRGRPGRQGRPSTGRASPATPARITYADLHALVCQAANTLTELGVTRRRPGRHLPADDPGGGGRDAGLRPDRRHAQRGVRRLLGRRAVQPDPGRRREARDHRRRRVPARQAVARSSRPSTRRPTACPSVEHVLVVRRTGQDVAWTEGRDLWWHDAVEKASADAHRRSRSTPSTRCSSSTPRARPRSRRASCTPPAAT